MKKKQSTAMIDFNVQNFCTYFCHHPTDEQQTHQGQMAWIGRCLFVAEQSAQILQTENLHILSPIYSVASLTALIIVSLVSLTFLSFPWLLITITNVDIYFS